NPQRRQRRSQLSSRVIRDRDQHGALYFIFFSNNSMAMIEEVEALGEVESVLRQPSRLGAGRGLRVCFIQPRSQHEERPDVVAGLTFEDFTNFVSVLGGDIARFRHRMLVDPVAAAPGTDTACLTRAEFSKD